ncbi:MAG: class I SAM-dependent methyltransferase [Terriglobales bacterium]
MGNPPVRARLAREDVMIGLDIDLGALRAAKIRYPQRDFVCCPAESLPFADSSFDRVVSSVALPYMDIPAALAEIRRVLHPGRHRAHECAPLGIYSERTSRRCSSSRTDLVPVLCDRQWFDFSCKREDCEVLERTVGVVPNETWNDNRAGACWLPGHCIQPAGGPADCAGLSSANFANFERWGAQDIGSGVELSPFGFC